MTTATIDEMRRSIARLASMVEELAERSGYDQAAARRNAGVDDQRFVYENRAHREKAEAIFKELGINENRRSWFYNKTLEGVRLGKLRELIESEDAKYRAKWGGRSKRA